VNGGWARIAALALALMALPGCEGTRSPPPAQAVGTTTTSAAAATTLASTTTVPIWRVSGHVTNADGSPLARARVSLGESTAMTGPDGWFELEVMAPGSIDVAKPGWESVEIPWQDGHPSVSAVMSPLRIRGIRVGGEAAGDDAMFQSLVDLADRSAINAFVFDTKQEGGDVLYRSSVPEATEIGAVKPAYDPAERVAQAHEAGLYTITRIVTFEDALRAAARPEEKLAGPWLDPRSASAGAYNLALAQEACDLGFDEIMFDYVRFPSGSTAKVTGQLEMSQDERVTAVTSFLAEASRLLNPMGCAVSAAVFGIVVSTSDDQGLGQRPEELSGHVDVLSPMVYPSHYSPGWLGYDDPNGHPYDVTSAAIIDGQARIDEGALLRPWLQAFWWNDAQIRSAIQAAEDLGSGWTLWNVRSNFDLEALPTDAEVAP